MNKRMNKRARWIVPAALSAVTPFALANTASMQDITPTETTEAERTQAKELSAFIVTGTRSDSRTVSSSLTPIDVVPADVLTQTGTSELATALARIIPSLNFPRPTGADTTDTVRPMQLRGLSPDQVLVLVNGKRWHPSSVMNLYYIGAGSQAVDLNTIPMSAIDHIEVLRDGASAQYGSDAIAGVVNIILKKSPEGGDVTVTGGQYSAGDGRQWQGAANFGIPLGDDKGSMRIAVQNGEQAKTNRARPDRRPGFTHLGPKFMFGDPKVSDKNLMLNIEYELAPNVEFYAFGHYGQRKGESPAYFRYGPDAPIPVSPLISNMYPNGFLPMIMASMTDRYLAAGLRGTVNGWRWDVGANYGGNRNSYKTRDTVNLAWLNDFGSAPKTYNGGILESGQRSFDIDIAKDVSVSWLPNPVTLAFGAEYLRQSYGIGPGELSAYYTTTNTIPDTTTVPSGASQGFAGWAPNNSGSLARHGVAEYLSLETNLTDRFALAAAVRHEDYSDFGTTTSGSLSGRFDFTDSFALRGSASTGFRAPSLGQQFYSTTTWGFYPIGNATGLPPGSYATGIVPESNPIARLLGSEALRPEKSRNYTLGAMWSPSDAFNLSVDIYQINIDNRIVLSSRLATTSPTVRTYLADNGIGDAGYSSLQYFTNAGNTLTRGMDLMGSYHSSLGNAGSLQTTLSFNYNKNKVVSIRPNPPVLDALGVSFQRLGRGDIKGLLNNSTPRSKVVLNERYKVGNWEVIGSATRYDRFTSYNATIWQYDQVYASKWVFDLAASYKLDQWTFTLGADNVFNTYPDKNRPDHDNNGVFPYSQYSPFGFGGAYAYGKVVYHW